MDEYRVSLYQYLPLVEILWNENLRESLDFLRSNLKTSKVIQQSFIEKKKYSCNNKIFPYVPQIGRFGWSFNKDCYVYLRNLQFIIRDDQPIRPLITFYTSPVKWLEIRNKLSETFNQNLIFKLYPNLVGEIEKSFSIKKIPAKKSFIEILEDSKQLFVEEQNQEKTRFMETVFKDTTDINLLLSDVLVVIESTALNFQNLGLISSVFDAERIKGGWIKELKHNYWLLIYGNPKPSSKLRERMKTALKLPFLLRVLGKRIQYILESRKEDAFRLRDRLSFFEFIISVLNPDYYSSREKFSFLLPKHYQRTLFNKISNLVKYDELYSSIKRTILKRVENWEPYEQYSVLSKNNIVLNQLKEELSIKFRKYPPMNLSTREIAILSMFRKEFVNQLQTEGVSRRYIEKYEIYAGRTKNFIVGKIKDWLLDNGYEGDLISQTELKEPSPKILQTLVDKDLLIKTPVKEEGSKNLYSLNLENGYIKRFVFEK